MSRSSFDYLKELIVISAPVTIIAIIVVPTTVGAYVACYHGNQNTQKYF